MTDTAVSIAPAGHAMPKVVWVPLAMMLVQVPVGLITTLFFPTVYFQSADVGIFLLLVSVVGTIVGIGLIALLAFGYGWVRHLYAIGAILGLPHLVSFLAQRFHSEPMIGAWVLASNLWFYAALVLLYSSSARAWFQDAKTRRNVASNNRWRGP